MDEIQWSYNGKAAIHYTETTAELIRNGLYSIGKFESAWKYYPLRYETPTYAGNAQSRYGFMVEAIYYILKHDGAEAAEKFVKEGSAWFRAYVSEEDGELDYKTVVKKLMTIIKEY